MLWYNISECDKIAKHIIKKYNNDRLEKNMSEIKRIGVLTGGGDCSGLLKEFFGAEVLETTKEHVVYISPQEKEEKYFEG